MLSILSELLQRPKQIKEKHHLPKVTVINVQKKRINQKAFRVFHLILKNNFFLLQIFLSLF